MDRQQLAEMQRAQKRARSLRAVSVLVFFGEVKQEVRRISWTPPAELWQSAKMVLLVMTMAGFAVFGMDLVLRFSVDLLEGLTKALVG